MSYSLTAITAAFNNLSGNINTRLSALATQISQVDSNATYAQSAGDSVLFDGKTFSEVVTAIAGTSSGLTTQDVQNNLEALTKADVGLGNVQNHGMAIWDDTDESSRTSSAAVTDAYTNPAFVNSLVSWKISSVVNGAPGTLDTLDEIAAALQDNPDVISTLEATVANKASTSYVDGEINDLRTELNGNIPAFAGTALIDSGLAGTATASELDDNAINLRGLKHTYDAINTDVQAALDSMASTVETAATDIQNG